MVKHPILTVLYFTALAIVLAVVTHAASTPPTLARWNATLRCTEVVVQGNAAQRQLICTGSMVPPECAADPQSSPPGICYEPSDGSLRFRDSSGVWRF